MDIRVDLSSQKLVLNPFLTTEIAPYQLTAQKAGVILAQQYKSLATLETDRSDSAEPDRTVDTFKNYSFSTGEKMNSRICDDRYIGFAGSKEKAQAQLARVAALAVMQGIESDTAKGLLDSATITSADATPTGTTLAIQIDTAVQALKQTAGVNNVALVCSEYVWTTLVLANTSVKDRIANPANIVYNSDTNFRDAKMQVFAGEFNLNRVLTGSNVSWYTAPTNKTSIMIMALPDAGMNPLDQMQVGTQVVYDYPAVGSAPVIGTYYDDRKHSEVVDGWVESVYVELNPELARRIKVA